MHACRGLACLRSALVDVRDTQAETLRHVEDLQRCMGAHGADRCVFACLFLSLLLINCSCSRAAGSHT